MMIMTKEGFIYKAVPNMVPRVDSQGNRFEVQEGYKSYGIPLMKVIGFDSDRVNQALEVIRATDLLIEEE